METSPVEHSHKDPVHKVIFPSSKTGKIEEVINSVLPVGIHRK